MKAYRVAFRPVVSYGKTKNKLGSGRAKTIPKKRKKKLSCRQRTQNKLWNIRQSEGNRYCETHKCIKTPLVRKRTKK